MPFYERGTVRIHYEEVGSGYPVLLFGPGGVRSTIEAWNRLEHIDPMTLFKDDVRLIGMDQRNAGESTGPLPADRPWESLVEDQAGLLDHLGVERCILIGCCMGCSFALSFIEQLSSRVQAAARIQPIGRIPGDSSTRLADGARRWAHELMEGRTDIDNAMIDRFILNMWNERDFVYSVSRDFVRSCNTPLLVLPGIDQIHPHEIGVEIGQLARNAETLDPWKDPPELIPQAMERIRQS